MTTWVITARTRCFGLEVLSSKEIRIPRNVRKKTATTVVAAMKMRFLVIFEFPYIEYYKSMQLSMHTEETVMTLSSAGFIFHILSHNSGPALTFSRCIKKG